MWLIQQSTPTRPDWYHGDEPPGGGVWDAQAMTPQIRSCAHGNNERCPPNRRPVVAGMTGDIRSMVTDERIYPIISTPATLSVRGTAPCSPPDYAKIRRQHLGERAKRQTLRRDRRWGMQARINDNKRKNKTAFTVPNNLNRPFPKGRSLARVSCYFGPRWSLLTLLTYVRPRTYQICTHVMDHIIHSLIL